MGRCHWPAVFNGEAKGRLCFHEDTRLIVLTCWKHFMDLFIRAVILTCEPFISFWICLYWLEFFFRESSSVFSELKFSCSLLCSFWIREIVSRSSYGKIKHCQKTYFSYNKYKYPRFSMVLLTYSGLLIHLFSDFNVHNLCF